MLSLLHTEQDQKVLHTEPDPNLTKVGEPVRDQEVVWKNKIDKNCTNWLYNYTIYVGVVVELYPKKADALTKHQDIIHRALRDFGGQAWLIYDENFKLRASHDPSLAGQCPSSRCAARFSCRPRQ